MLKNGVIGGTMKDSIKNKIKKWIKLTDYEKAFYTLMLILFFVILLSICFFLSVVCVLHLGAFGFLVEILGMAFRISC